MPSGVRRVVLAGASGAGKTTLARRIGVVLNLPVVELDALHHGAGWIPRPEFERDVRRFAATDRWVTEYQYSSVRPVLLARADLLVWLALPRCVVMGRVTRRTLRRRFRREELWNGNVEQALWRIFVDPEHIIREAWTTYPRTAERVAEARLRRPDLSVVRLCRPRDVDRWLAGLSG